MASTTSRKNPRALARTRRVALEFGKLRGRVGYAKDMGASEETVTIAAINFLGAPGANIPARDALTPVMEENRARIQQASRKAARAVNRGDDPEPEIEELMADLEFALKRSVEDFSNPPNADSTEEQKGFNDPLVGKGADGGRLVREAAARVTKR